MKNKWFEVDKEGMSKILARRGGKAFIVFELIQNAWDQDTTIVSVTLKPVPNRPIACLIVSDNDPEGFSDIRDAFTLFAESKKKQDPTKRGRFNIGEKLVLACCEEATISTTKGCISFLSSGERKYSKLNKTASGSIFYAMVRMTRNEYEDVCESVNLLIPPNHIKTLFNSIQIPSRNPITEISVSLPTEIQDKDGNLKRTIRKTTINVHEPLNGETAYIYEMGIPIVETGDKYHVDIQQKVPLNSDRDNVQPSYLKAVRTAVLNGTHEYIVDAEDSSAEWVSQALENESCTPEATRSIVTKRYGNNAVSFDPSDVEGSKIAVSKGMTVVSGGSFNARQWKNIKESGALLPAGKVTPSPKPFTKEGRPLSFIHSSNWTGGMYTVTKYATLIAKELLNTKINVRITNDSKWPFTAAYGNGELILNFAKLGDWVFSHFPETMEEWDRLLIHEFAHHYSTDHLSSEYHDIICKLGAGLKKLALDKPKLFKFKVCDKVPFIIPSGGKS